MKEFDGRYFVSVVAARWEAGVGNRIMHNLCTYDRFANEDEVLGRAAKWAEENWPQNDGWRHGILIMPYDAPNRALAKGVPS